MIYKDEWDLINPDGSLNYDYIIEEEIEVHKKTGKSVNLSEEAREQARQFYETNKDEILQGRVRVDIAVYFTPNRDNDFTGYFEEVFNLRVIPRLKYFLEYIDFYTDDAYVENSVRWWLDPERLLKNLADRGDDFSEENLKKAAEDAIDCTMNYVFSEGCLKVGTVEEVESLVDKKLGENGEVLIMKVIDNKVTLETW